MGIFATRPGQQSSIALYFVRNSVDSPPDYGNIPGAGTVHTLPFLSEDLRTDTKERDVQISTPDGSPPGKRRVGKAGENKALSMHLAPGDLMTGFLEMGMMNLQVVRDIGPVSTIAFDATDNSINDTANGLGGLRKRSWIQLSGAPAAANKGRARVESVTAGKVILSAIALEDAAAGDNITVRSTTIDTGKTLVDACIERHYTDFATGGYRAYPGVVIPQVQIGWTKEDLFKFSMQVNHAGDRGRTDATALPAAANPVVDISGLVCDASNNLTRVFLDKTLRGDAEEFDLTLSNNLSAVGASGIPEWWVPGNKTLSGSSKFLLLEGDHLLDILDDHATVPIEFEVVPDGGPIDYVFSIHNAKFDGRADFPRSGDGATMASPSWSAVFPEDPGDLMTLSILPKV